MFCVLHCEIIGIPSITYYVYFKNTMHLELQTNICVFILLHFIFLHIPSYSFIFLHPCLISGLPVQLYVCYCQLGELTGEARSSAWQVR